MAVIAEELRAYTVLSMMVEGRAGVGGVVTPDSTTSILLVILFNDGVVKSVELQPNGIGANVFVAVVPGKNCQQKIVKY